MSDDELRAITAAGPAIVMASKEDMLALLDERDDLRRQRDAHLMGSGQIGAGHLLYLLAAACAAAGSQREWAKANGISPQYLTDILKGRRQPNDRIARCIGWRRVVAFEKDTTP